MILKLFVKYFENAGETYACNVDKIVLRVIKLELKCSGKSDIIPGLYFNRYQTQLYIYSEKMLLKFENTY